MDHVPDSVKHQIVECESICRSFLSAALFVASDAGRSPRYLDNHLLSYVFQDYLQSAIAMPILIREGVLNVCKRELRFILELSIKLCFAQQQQYASDVATKINTLKATFDSTNISMQKQLKLQMLPPAELPSFYDEVGRIYGETSNYVHLSQAQIRERVAMVDAGRTSGLENADDITTLPRLLSRGLACSFVFLLHAVPDHVAGDLLVESNGGSFEWYFARSKFLAYVDEHFDYKSERQSGLAEIKRARWSRVDF